MAISIGKKKAEAPAAAAETPAAETKKPGLLASKPKEEKAAPAGDKPKASFLKTGKAATEAFSTAEAQAEAAKNGMFRFFIPKKNIGEAFKLVFLDGEIGEDGMLSNPMFWEYTVNHGGKWQNFVKPNDEEGPDPIAADGNKASLVQVFTVLNLTPYTKKDGTVVEVHKQLFVCKRGTMKRLAQLAKKRDGSLAGCVFEVTRTNDKAENVGDMFDFDQRVSVAELVEQFGAEMAAPANYGETIEYRSVAELKKLGFGAGSVSIKAGEVGADEKYGEEL